MSNIYLQCRYSSINSLYFKVKSLYHIAEKFGERKFGESANRLLIVSTNLDGFILANYNDLPNSSNFPAIWYTLD